MAVDDSLEVGVRISLGIRVFAVRYFSPSELKTDYRVNIIYCTRKRWSNGPLDRNHCH